MLGKHRETDLLLICAFTLIQVAVVLAFPQSGLKAFLGLPFLLFSPGYVVLAVIFNRRDSLRLSARIAFSLILSIASIIVIGLILNFTPWGIGLNSILLTTAVFIILLAGLASYLRNRSPDKERASDSRHYLNDLSAAFRAAGKGRRIIVIGLLIAIIGIGGTAIYPLAKPVAETPLTEFFILGPEGHAENYPTALRTGEEGRVYVGIINREYRQVEYCLEIKNREDILFTSSPTTLAHNEYWLQPAAFIPPNTGERERIEFFLYEDGELSEKIRYLWVSVTND